MGEYGTKARAIEKETDTKILFMTTDVPRYIHTRCRITGTSKAVARAETLILQAQAELGRFNCHNPAPTNFDVREEQHPQLSLDEDVSQPQNRLLEQFQPERLAFYHASPTVSNSGTSIENLSAGLSGRTKTCYKLQNEADETPVQQSNDQRVLMFTESRQPTLVANEYMDTPSTAENATIAHPVTPESPEGNEPIQRLPTRAPSKPTSTETPVEADNIVAEKAVIIEIEDDHNRETPSRSTLPMPGETGRRTPLLSLPNAASRTDTNVSPLSLHDSIQALLEERKSRIHNVERECRMLKYTLEYLGVSEVQMQVLQQRFNVSRNGKWDESCHAVLGCSRRKTKG